jgi:hypothetical protein
MLFDFQMFTTNSVEFVNISLKVRSLFHLLCKAPRNQSRKQCDQRWSLISRHECQ